MPGVSLVSAGTLYSEHARMRLIRGKVKARWQFLLHGMRLVYILVERGFTPILEASGPRSYFSYMLRSAYP